MPMFNGNIVVPPIIIRTACVMYILYHAMYVLSSPDRIIYIINNEKIIIKKDGQKMSASYSLKKTDKKCPQNYSLQKP